MSDAAGSGWTGPIFLTTIAAMVIAVLAFALSAHRDARIAQDDVRPQMSSSADAGDAGNGVVR